MDKGIFEGARFGDMFLTRDGKKVLFISYLDDIDAYHCVVENWYDLLDYTPDGKAFTIENHPTDIVSKYHKEIDEDELEEIVDKKYFDEEQVTQRDYDLANAFKAGYRKAKKE